MNKSVITLEQKECLEMSDLQKLWPFEKLSTDAN